MATQPMQSMQLLAPDIASEQNQLMRRQQMADLLRKQSLENSGNTEVINGWAVKKSPFEGLSKMAQALGANYIQDKTDTRQLELAKALQDRLGSVASGGGAGLSSGDAAAAAMSTNSAGPTNFNAAMQTQLMAPVNAPADNKYGNQNLLRSLAINALGGDQASSAYWKDQERTEAFKRDRELGITAPESKSSELAKRLKEGTMSFTPGQMNRLPDGSNIVAPNFDTGVAGGIDAQGRPFVNEIPKVASIAASRAGDIKRSEAIVADQFSLPSKFDAAGGPVAMTNSQARAAANNGIDPAYPNSALVQSVAPVPSMFQAPKPVTAPRRNSMASTAAESDQAMIFSNELKTTEAKLSATTDPAERARLQSDVAGLRRELGRVGVQPSNAAPSAQSSGLPGIKLQDDAARAKEVATAQADVVRDTDKQKATKLRGQLTAGVDRAIELLNQGPTASGAGSVIDNASNFFGKSTKGADLASQLDTLSGWITSNVPRMEGPQSDKDVANYRIMGAEVGDRTKPVSQRLAAAGELQRLQAKYAHLNGGNENTGGATSQWGAASSASPSIKSLLDKYK